MDKNKDRKDKNKDKMDILFFIFFRKFAASLFIDYNRTIKK